MEDRHKFRAWDDKNKKMWKYAVPLFRKTYNGGTIEVSDYEDGGVNEFIKGELIQCTGRKDRDDDLVFEGDIIEIDLNDEKSIHLIAWEDEGEDGYPAYDLRPPYEIECNSLGFIINEPGLLFKVIGNKFKNLELLERIIKES